MSLAVGTCTTYVVTDSGELYSWGQNDCLQLGQSGDESLSSNPTKVGHFGSMVSSVTSKDSRAGCIIRDGTVFTWGAANRSNVNVTEHVLAPPSHIGTDQLCGERATQVECGEFFTYIATDLGSVFQSRVVDRVIGNALGETLPDGMDPDTILTESNTGEQYFREHESVSRVERVHFSNMPIKMIAAGHYHVLAGGLYQGLFTWGANTDGCLGRGLGKHLTTSTPAPVPAFQSHRLTCLSAAFRHSIVVSAGTTGVTGVRIDDAGVFGWGSNLAGQLGVGYGSLLHVQPVRIDPAHFDHENITMIACAESCTAVMSETGKMWIFGNTNSMSERAWSVAHALHARGISRIDDGITVDSDEESGDSDSDDDSENETDHRGRANETKYLFNILPQRVRQEHVLGARFSSVAVGKTHMAATTEDGHLYMFYGGIIPVLYRPSSQPTSLTGVDPGVLLRQACFGGRRVAYRPAGGGESGMSRRDAAPYAAGRFRSHVEYGEHVGRARVQRLRYWQRQDAVAGEAATAAPAPSSIAHIPPPILSDSELMATLVAAETAVAAAEARVFRAHHAGGGA